MSITAIGWIFQRCKAPATDRLVFLAIAYHLSEKNIAKGCWPSIGRLASMTGLSARQVTRSIGRLEERRMLYVLRNASMHGVNHYWVTDPDTGEAMTPDTQSGEETAGESFQVVGKRDATQSGVRSSAEDHAEDHVEDHVEDHDTQSGGADRQSPPPLTASHQGVTDSRLSSPDAESPNQENRNSIRKSEPGGGEQQQPPPPSERSEDVVVQASAPAPMAATTMATSALLALDVANDRGDAARWLAELAREFPGAEDWPAIALELVKVGDGRRLRDWHCACSAARAIKRDVRFRLDAYFEPEEAMQQAEGRGG